MSTTEITENKHLVEDVLGSRARVKIIKALAFDEGLTICIKLFFYTNLVISKLNFFLRNLPPL